MNFARIARLDVAEVFLNTRELVLDACCEGTGCP